ncbi:chromatin modification-related protein EAF1 B-like isoform X6 [Panicum virgatum]|uniref:chromatin modification-related protein EAF1 B-like isoform X6 n=1 Tax=Panicum virgatum TaxID=38727 RepID=UPI0019D65631|nr:chromatin modification-related protein EAF1 B-like isoform X6 [Panicum virgatum]XP_039840618.1 chromatin modification-related protein EAF1 B-like isoform X6 [Panicum virgatum]XP_039840619.1 chromatin modification-related protein EAF1 B-like isoform X6 [Panicum virgatum]
MVNAKPCSMGGLIDYGVDVGTKTSPRSLAIAKVQEELRQEFDVREERRRELEFLEKGGNPLDFKFIHVETVSVHSASLTNQTEAQNVISDAKGSFSASPHGDSVESSDRPGSSLCRETNIADNLMLLDGNNNGIAEGKIVKKGTKRLNAAQPKQSLPNDGHKNAKKPVLSGLSRLGDKSQAYVRRNRSKPSRESANVASVRSSIPPAKGYETKDENDVLQKSNVGDHGEFSVSSIKQSGSNYDNEPKNAASDGQAEMELDVIHTIDESECVVNEEAKQADDNSKAKEVSSHDANYNQLLGSGEIIAEVASAETPDTSLKVPKPYHSASTHDERESCAVDKKADDGHLNKHMAHIHEGKLDSRRKVPVCAVEVSISHKNVVGAPCQGTMNIIDDHADGDTNPVAAKIDVKYHEDLDCSICYSMKESSDLVQPEANLQMKDEMEVCDSAIVAQKDTGCLSSINTMNIEESASDRKNSCVGDSDSTHPISVGIDLPKALPTPKNDEPNLESEIKKSKAHEDSILKDARAIEASIRRAGERSHCNIALEKRSRSHWDFVLEEMAWMANDFMQERLWKSMAAAKMCHWVASDGRAKFVEASIQRKQKHIMKIIAKGIMSFWHSAEALQTADVKSKLKHAHNSTMPKEMQPSGIKAEKEQVYKSLGAKESRQPWQSQIQDYAVRFLEYNSKAADSHVLPEAPPTPDRLNDFGILKLSDHLSEESLFYTVPPGAMPAYRESLESLSVHHKEVGNAELNDDYEASVCDSAADLLRENAYEEDEGEICAYLSPKAYDGGCLSNMGYKKKHLMEQRISVARPYEIGTNVPYEPCLESKSANQPLLSNGKRPTSFLTIPPKRIRTAARQRVVSSFHAGASGPPQVTSKTDASSGDTNSCQDDQSSLHGGSFPWRYTDFESTVESNRQLPYDASEVCTKANKKKKLKNPGYKIAQNTVNSSMPTSVKFQGRMYDPRLQGDLTNKYEQKEYLKKRSDIHQYDSNGNSVAYGGQHASKKLKILKQGVDISQEASHAASQMSNMANSARFIKFITNRDRGRRCKALKMTSVGGWSNFEDQALVVLVHDMGQNWELVCDAINSIVQFKSVHRQPKECKERHKVLVDRSSGDGADSAEDSGSSQHYHSTLPGIPKGSARQLFERLQGPFDEENLKAHFEKIILLMQQVHARRRQGNRQEFKPIIQPHSSHVIALSQACPNRISASTLMPLDLCDVTSPNLDSIAPGSVYSGPHANGISLPNHQGSVCPSTPTSNLNSRLPGSPGVVPGNNSPSPSTLNSPRDAQKYGVPRPTLQGDEQPKIQFNQMVNGRNLQQPGASVTGAFPSGVDLVARMMPTAHGMGMVAGQNRGMPAARPGFPRINSPVTLNAYSSGNMLPNGGQGVASAVNVYPGAISGPGNSILRPCDPMQTLRPVQGIEEHRQMPEFDMQVAQGSSQATIQFDSMNPSFSSVAASSPVQQPQQPHQMSQSLHTFGNPHHSQVQGTSSGPQQQPYPVHLAKERQTQQRMAPQQHSDVSGASAVLNVQNNTQILQQGNASAANPVPSSQPQHQQQQAAQNVPDSSLSPNQSASITQQKQKKQQGQQQPRQNHQQRNQGSQQAKLMKSLGRGNMLIPQIPPIDSTPAAASTPPKKHVSEKLVQHGQGQGLIPANTAPMPSMPQPGNQPKLINSLPQSPKKMPDIGNQCLMQGSSSQTLLAMQQLPFHSKPTLTTELQQQLNNPSQNSIDRAMVQQKHQTNPDCRTGVHIDQVHNQMVPTSLPQSADSGSPVVPLVNQQKQEASHNLASVTPSLKLHTSPKVTSFGSETLSSEDLLQRQVSDGFPVRGHGVGGQWNQQVRQQLQPQHQQRPVIQGSVYAPSNSGPG